MLNYMRRNAGSWIIKAMLVGVALSFVIGFGILPTLRNKEDQGYIVAEVGEKRITRGEWNLAYENLLRLYQQMYNDQLTDEMVKQMHLRETALDNLITGVLEQKEAERLHLQVSDDELQTRIRSVPYFQKDGVFDREVYLRVLRLNRLTPEMFENQQREQILLEKLQQLVRGTVKISDLELWQSYVLEQQKVNLTFVSFDPQKYQKTVEIEEDSLQQYFQQNGEAFRTPEKVKFAYVRFPEETCRGRVEVHTGDIEEYYDSHLDEFAHPEEMRLRHILLKIEPKAEEAAVQEKRKLLEGILERVRKGEDFAQLARAHSEDASAMRGGDLGYVKKGELVPQVESAVIGLKPGEVSGIVTSPFGLHILKMEDYRAAKEDPLEEVKDRIRAAIVQEKAWHMARRLAEEFLWEAKKNKKMEGVLLAGEAIAVEQTDFLALGEAIPAAGKEDVVLQAAFSLEKGAMSEVIKGQKAYYVIQTMDRKSPEIPPFEEVRTTVEEKYREAKSQGLARTSAERALERLRKAGSLDPIASEEDLKVQETGLFSRLQAFVPRIGKSEELVEVAFSLTEKNPWPSKSFEVKGKHYLVGLKERVVPKWEDMIPEKDKLLDEQRRRKEEEIYRDWLSGLRERQKVKVAALEGLAKK